MDSAAPGSQQRKRQRTFPSTTALSYGTSYLQPEASSGPHTNDFFTTPNISMPVEGQPYPSLDNMPLEGHESMMWYDQLFASSFSAIDNPFLVNAEFDASVDPTWNSLR